MILAEKEIKSSEEATENTVVKVHGFSSPIGKLDPNIQPTPVVPPQKNSPSSQLPPHQVIHPHLERTFSEKFYHWWHKIAVILLSIHGLVGIWESIKFMAIDFIELEEQLELHQIEIEEVNQVIALAVVVAGTAFINIFMAFRLNKVQETTAHNIDLFIATILIIGTKYIQQTLIQFDLLSIFIK